jgi:hypothetical protein
MQNFGFETIDSQIGLMLGLSISTSNPYMTIE